MGGLPPPHTPHCAAPSSRGHGARPRPHSRQLAELHCAHEHQREQGPCEALPAALQRSRTRTQHAHLVRTAPSGVARRLLCVYEAERDARAWLCRVRARATVGRHLPPHHPPPPQASVRGPTPARACPRPPVCAPLTRHARPVRHACRHAAPHVPGTHKRRKRCGRANHASGWQGAPWAAPSAPAKRTPPPPRTHLAPYNLQSINISHAPQDLEKLWEYRQKLSIRGARYNKQHNAPARVPVRRVCAAVRQVETVETGHATSF